MNDLRELIRSIKVGKYELAQDEPTERLFHDTVTSLQKQLKFWAMSDWSNLDAIIECLAHMLIDFNNPDDDGVDITGPLETLEVKLRDSCQDYKEWGDLMQERS